MAKKLIALAFTLIILFAVLTAIIGVHFRTSRNKLGIAKPEQKLASGQLTLKKVGPNQVVVDNGIIQVTFSSPQGLITGIKYKGFDNVLNNKIKNRGYWDVMWYEPGQEQLIDLLEGVKFNVINQTSEHVEISFSRAWKISQRGSLVPLNVDKRGVSGIYMYAVLEKLKGWPTVDMDQTRIVFKLNTKFDFMAISDQRQKIMPSEIDRDITNKRANPLAYKEAVRLINPQNHIFKGQVDDKYMYSTENKDNKVHGWISSDQRVGFWMITPSDEFRVCGPLKQELTSHVGPTTLSMFTSLHYAGKDMNTTYTSMEPWKKVYGPVFVYLNSASSPNRLWTDAKRQMVAEVHSWPYDFVKSVDYPLHQQRGAVKGQFFVMDRYISKSKLFGKFAFVGLAMPGEAGSWQTENKGYQFWTTADRMGIFTITNVRPGSYNLYAWVSGHIGDYKYERDITITPGREIDVGAILYEPPRIGATLWEIGKPDRTAAEFYIPDPDPTLSTKLYLNNSYQPQDRFRQYGLWDRYTALYPRNDLVYIVGVSDYKKDWFYAHVTRNAGNGTYQATTWQIVFSLKAVIKTGNYTFRMALAAATTANLSVRINVPTSKPIFMIGLIGQDNAIARHGIHGLYNLYDINVGGNLLRGLHYGDTNQCFDDGYRFKDTNECFVTGADRCVCKPWLGTPSWLSSSPVKKLKVLKFGEITNYKDDMDKQSDLINYFVETMPNLEEVVLYYDTPFDSDLEIVSNGFQQLEKVVSTKCKIQVVSDSISFTTTVHSSSSSSTSGLVFFKNTFPACTFMLCFLHQCLTVSASHSMGAPYSNHNGHTYPLPHEIFVSKTLVRLKLGEGHDVAFSADVEDVFLPKLKILDIDSVVFEEEGVGFARLLFGCPVLEELVLTNMGWENWEFCSVSVTTLKRLTIFLDDFDENPMSVAFDTRNLEYLEYSDNIAREYPKVNFSSLVEAHIGLRLSEDQSADADFSEEDGYFSEEYEEEKEMVGNATNFLLGLCNVQILYLSAKTLEVFTFCCEATPVFNNLIQLTVESNDESGWDSLPALLPNCPNLETLIFKGLVHKSTDGCGNMCLCKPLKNPSCLSSSAVKVLKIILSVDIDDEGMEMEQIVHFLEKMPRLEQLVVYFNISSYDPSVFDLSKKLQSIPRIASPKCNFQVISPNLSLSSTLPSTLSKIWSAPPNEEYSWFLKALK
ncbi:unnamed protein product [Brassica rapa subsp. narinosa]